MSSGTQKVSKALGIIVDFVVLLSFFQSRLSLPILNLTHSEFLNVLLWISSMKGI